MEDTYVLLTANFAKFSSMDDSVSAFLTYRGRERELMRQAVEAAWNRLQALGGKLVVLHGAFYIVVPSDAGKPRWEWKSQFVWHPHGLAIAMASIADPLPIREEAASEPAQLEFGTLVYAAVSAAEDPYAAWRAAMAARGRTPDAQEAPAQIQDVLWDVTRRR